MEIGFRAKTVIVLLWGSKCVVLNSTNTYPRALLTSANYHLFFFNSIKFD